MIARILFAGILAGLIAGIFATGAQAVKVWPLILQAEVYENSGDTDNSQANDEAAEEEVESWGPQDGFERSFYSLVSNLITGVAYSLIMTAVILLSKQGISLKSGLVWGAAGFVAFMLAPALGLPPEVPGTVAAGVQERQIWWTVTVAMSSAGLAIFAFKSQWQWIVLGIALMIAPHIFGAPVPEHHASLAPAWITAEFVVATIATAGAFWLVLGGTLGWLLNRIAIDEA